MRLNREMELCSLWVLVSTLCLLCAHAGESYYDFRMPGVRTDQDDQYLCYAEDFEHNRTYITGFEPLRDPVVTHHMILFSCEEPGSSESVWKCDGGPGSSPVCNSEPKIIFSWAMEAPSFKLPANISLPVGGPKYKFLVLQVHYKDYAAFKNSPEKQDRSGFRMTFSPEPTKNVAGVYLFASDHAVPANSNCGLSTSKKVENSTLRMQCSYNGRTLVHPFAFRVHAHSHGVLNRGFILHEGKKYLIGEMSPQKPQTYYSTNNQSLIVHPGDILEAQCLMENKEPRDIPIGHSRKDEMCNFYMMYSVPKEDEAQLDDPNFQQCVIDPTAIEEKLEEEMEAMEQYLPFGYGEEEEGGEEGDDGDEVPLVRAGHVIDPDQPLNWF